MQIFASRTRRTILHGPCFSTSPQTKLHLHLDCIESRLPIAGLLAYFACLQRECPSSQLTYYQVVKTNKFYKKHFIHNCRPWARDKSINRSIYFCETASPDCRSSFFFPLLSLGFICTEMHKTQIRTKRKLISHFLARTTIISWSAYPDNIISFSSGRIGRGGGHFRYLCTRCNAKIIGRFVRPSKCWAVGRARTTGHAKRWVYLFF